MTSQTNSRYAFRIVCALAAAALLVVAGSVATGNSQQGATQGAAIDISVLHAGTDTATMPVLVAEAI